MFEPELLEKIIDLHAKSYRLFMWINRGIKAGRLDFSHMHAKMTAIEAAEDWLRRNWDSIPRDARPSQQEVTEFCHMFVSYLTTSFETVAKPRRIAYRYCCCGFCIYVASRDHVKLKKVTENAKATATELKRAYLRDLGDEMGRALSDDDVSRLLGDQNLGRSISTATYARELVRRAQFASQGKGLLVLWRQIAWKGTVPDREFELTAKEVLKAEREIGSRITCSTTA